MPEGRYVYDISGKEVKISIGGRNFDMQVYDCVQKKFFNVLSIETQGRTVKVHLGEWCEDVLIYE